MRVRISRLAQADMRVIGDRIAEEIGSRRAREFVLDLREKCLGLNRMPERFALLTGFEEASVRRRVSGNYLIVYRMEEASVEILRIFQVSMDYERLLNRDIRLSNDPDMGLHS
jgi:plasmid stabilization system protein ParE